MGRIGLRGTGRGVSGFYEVYLGFGVKGIRV